jgi:hypothetical protein
MELELQFTVVADVGSTAKFDLKIISMGGNDAIRDEQVQRIKLKFAVAPHAMEQGVPGTRAHSSSIDDESNDILPL